MKQNIRLIKQNVWFDKIEPYTQIEIMKIIAVNGFLSKKNIAIKMFGKEPTNSQKKLVDAVVSKMLNEKNTIIQPVKKEKEEGTKPSTLYSLTEKGIKTLTKYSFEKNNKNDKEHLTGKKYLNLEEIVIFVNRYEKDYIDQQSNNILSEWESVELTKEDMRRLYSDKDKKLYITLIERTGNNSSKLKKLIKQFRDAEQKINNALEEIPQALYETIEFSRR